uniref:Uncharacterized protein n=1 Tax=Panagrolaimus sp. PS1159 TaxID=55785 RepID=A0AC35GJ81_9BILA
MFTTDSAVILSSFSHARLTKFAALIKKSNEIDVKEITVKIIKLGKLEILEAIQGMDCFIIVCREATEDLKRIKKDFEETGKISGNIFTFEEIDKAIAESNTFGSSLCRRIGSN